MLFVGTSRVVEIVFPVFFLFMPAIVYAVVFCLA